MTAKKLSTYQAKRNFTLTREPAGDTTPKGGQRLRFVVQKHAATRLHYDLRLEFDGVFKSWAVTRGPSLDPRDKRLAVEVEDHPLDYGDFEGTIPEGQYGGGTVQLWDRGYWSPEGMTPEAGLAAGDLKFTLEGEHLHGSWVLVRVKNWSGGKRVNWLLIKHRDECAHEGDNDALLADDRSVASGRRMADIAAGKEAVLKPFMAAEGANPKLKDAVADLSVETAVAARVERKKSARTPRTAKLPDFIAPQLCRSLERPPVGDGWVHEIKFDGYRIQARIEAGKVVLRTRNGLDWTPRLSAIAASCHGFPDAIIDGEVVALDANGAPDFATLQAALAENATDNLIFFVFDLLYAGAEDLRGRALSDRKKRLQTLLSALPQQGGPLLRYVDHFGNGGDAVLLSACRPVGCRWRALYRSGRIHPISQGGAIAGPRQSATLAMKSSLAPGPTRTGSSVP